MKIFASISALSNNIVFKILCLKYPRWSFLWHYMTVTKNFISDAAGVFDLPGDIKFSFCIDHHVNFPCLQKKLCHYFFDSLWRFLISDIFFWKVDKLELLEVLRSFDISRHDFSQIFRTSFNIICKNNFRHERWESDEDWFWPFEPISKLKTTYKYWASIKFGTASMKLKQKRHRSNDDS